MLGVEPYLAIHIPWGLEASMSATGKTDISRHLGWAAVFLASLALAPLPSLAEGLINPFNSEAIGLSKADTELMKGALKSVLDAKKAGATAEWKSASTGRAGRATSLKIYKQGGMDCANVKHDFTAGGGATYQLPFCLTADGKWKVAF
jgi:surface antigen